MSPDELAEIREWVDARMAEPGFPPVGIEMAHALLAEVASLQAQLAAVREFLDRDEHVVDIQPKGFGLQHSFPCRPDLLECPVNRALEALDKAPAKVGRYKVWLDQDGGVVIGERVADDYDPLNIRAVLDGR